MTQETRIRTLALKMAEQVTAEHSHADVLGALSLATVSFIVDYLVLAGQVVDEANISYHIGKIAEINASHALFLLQDAGFPQAIETLKELPNE